MDVMVRPSIVRSLSWTLHTFAFRKLDAYHLILILIKEVEMGGVCGTNGKEKFIKVIMEKTKDKKPLGRLGGR
jgi:hypothetical protein